MFYPNTFGHFLSIKIQPYMIRRVFPLLETEKLRFHPVYPHGFLWLMCQFSGFHVVSVHECWTDGLTSQFNLPSALIRKVSIPINPYLADKGNLKSSKKICLMR